MATITRENIGLLHEKLVVKITKDDYLKGFEQQLKTYTKQANIPGFRKGMVPVGMVKKMYGKSIFTEEILKTAEKDLLNYLETEKPEIFAQPLPLNNDISHFDFNNPSEYTFEFEIGLKPEVSLADFSKANATFNKVEVTNEMVQKEVESMLLKAGKPTVTDIVNNETVSIEFGFKKDTHEESFQTILIDYVNLTPEIKLSLEGKKVEELFHTTINKLVVEEKGKEILQKLESQDDTNFEIKIQEIFRQEKSEMNETFYKLVFPNKDLKTADEFNETLKEEMQQQWNSQSKAQLQDQVYHYLIDNTAIEYPEQFLKNWLQTAGEKEKTSEQVEAEFPNFKNQLKWNLISDKIIKDNNLNISNEELREFIKAEVMGYFGGMQMGETNWIESYIDNMMKDKKHVESSYHRLMTDKVLAFLETQVTPTEKTITADELMALQHNHKH